MPRRALRRLIGVAVPLTVVVASGILWHVMTATEVDRLRDQTEIQATHAADGIHQGLRTKRLLISRLAERIGDRGRLPTQAEWEIEAANILRDFTGLGGFGVVDRDGTVVAVVSGMDYSEQIGLHIGVNDALMDLFEQARVTGGLRVSGSTGLRTGGRGMFLAAPITIGGDFAGITLATINYDQLFDYSLRNIVPGYLLKITDVDGVVHTRDELPDDPPYGVLVRQEVELPGADWTIHIAPGPERVAEAISHLPKVIFVSGVLVAGLLALTIRYAIAAELTSTRLEQEVARRTRELERVNAELEAFNYSVSHDLRTPLRAISGFGEILSDEYSNVLDETGRHYLRRIMDGVMHMGRLIDDLLSLARVSHSEMRMQDIDLAGMAREILSNYREAEPGRDVRFEAPDSLPARGDPGLLNVALDNLLGNAWKFTGKRDTATIELGVRDGAYYVKDDGVGFDMEYADRAFALFHRMHHADEFPGTGVGLATVHRIIERHGGRIWCEAEPDGGACFMFTLDGEAV